ncbi:MAG: YkvA family protein [Elusimicrobiota bacterium]|jgi:uncharacterized membrane protein YkvA (DUF1232 family)
MDGKIFAGLSPKTKAALLAAACVLYILSPIDVIPDLTPVLGWIDDAVVLVLTLAAVWRRLKGTKTSPPPNP